MVKNELYWHRFQPASFFNKRQLGAMPQVSHDQGWNIFTQGDDFKGLIYNFNQSDKFPDEFIVPRLIANKKAKVSDFLQLGSLTLGTFIASERTKQLLDDFHLPQHQIFKTKAIFPEEEYEYYIYHFYESNLENIDFDKSTFFKDYIGFSQRENDRPDDQLLSFPNKKQLLLSIDKFKKEFFGILAKPLVLKKEPTEYDLLYIRHGFIGFFISNDLKKELIKNGINGWAINSEQEYFYYGIHKYKWY